MNIQLIRTFRKFLDPHVFLAFLNYFPSFEVNEEELQVEKVLALMKTRDAQRLAEEAGKLP